MLKKRYPAFFTARPRRARSPWLHPFKHFRARTATDLPVHVGKSVRGNADEHRINQRSPVPKYPAPDVRSIEGTAKTSVRWIYQRILSGDGTPAGVMQKPVCRRSALRPRTRLNSSLFGAVNRARGSRDENDGNTPGKCPAGYWGNDFRAMLAKPAMLFGELNSSSVFFCLRGCSGECMGENPIRMTRRALLVSPEPPVRGQRSGGSTTVCGNTVAVGRAGRWPI